MPTPQVVLGLRPLHRHELGCPIRHGFRRTRTTNAGTTEDFVLKGRGFSRAASLSS
jgi:hypothetical protein